MALLFFVLHWLWPWPCMSARLIIPWFCPWRGINAFKLVICQPLSLALVRLLLTFGSICSVVSTLSFNFVEASQQAVVSVLANLDELRQEDHSLEEALRSTEVVTDGGGEKALISDLYDPSDSTLKTLLAPEAFPADIFCTASVRQMPCRLPFVCTDCDVGLCVLQKCFGGRRADDPAAAVGCCQCSHKRCFFVGGSLGFARGAMRYKCVPRSQDDLCLCLPSKHVILFV